MTGSRVESYDSVRDALADSPAESANLRMRAELMQKIATLIRSKGWTQAEAATHCSVSQPRINDLLQGRISRFSLDALVNIAAAMGQTVHVKFEAA
jgi:predicted XRE-type DNA-binding protein